MCQATSVHVGMYAYESYTCVYAWPYKNMVHITYRVICICETINI